MTTTSAPEAPAHIDVQHQDRVYRYLGGTAWTVRGLREDAHTALPLNAIYIPGDVLRRVVDHPAFREGPQA